MELTYYDAFIPLFKDAAQTLLMILRKVESTPLADTIADASIHETMRPFKFQVHMVTRLIDKVVADATGRPVAKFEDNLTSLSAMIGRVEEMRIALESTDRDTFNGRLHNDVLHPWRPADPIVQVPSWQYVQGYAIPNVFFHLVTAYDIARMQGVALGKVDYLRQFAWKYYKPQLDKLGDK